MSAAAEYLGLVGWKQYTTTRSGAKFHIGLHDQASGGLIALLEADRLGQMRTGAVTGVAAKHLASADAVTVGVLGSGWQAQSQLEAVAAARRIERAFVYSRDAQRRSAFASKMSKMLDIEVTAVDEPRQAVEGLPVVITATTSRVPVFDGELLDEQSMVCAIGSNWLNKAEIDVTTIGRAKLVVCDSVECCRREAGDFVPALEQGLFRWEDAVSLGEVVSRQPATRDQQEGVTIFKSVGMAIEDVAVSAKVFELAQAAGKGEVLQL
jgi:ornithine cyclodeaminase/alanine dehydrogenase-like protein (mu-crystallin family)